MGLEQIDVELQEYMGSDRQIAEAAWTSSLSLRNKLRRTHQDVERVVRMMAESGHGTPFEAVVMRFWIRMPIFTDRQHMTHRVATHNGLSGRYRTLPDDWYELPEDVADIITKGLIPLHGTDKYIAKWIKNFNHHCRESMAYYQELVSQLKTAKDSSYISNDEYKRSREVLRAVLPVGNMTERVSVFNLRSFANYMRHRLSPHAQKEIQHVATLMLEEVKAAKVAPVAIDALEQRDWLIEPDLPK